MVSAQENNYVVQFSEGEFKYWSIGIPKPKDDEVIIKVAYSAINPHDRYDYYLSPKNDGYILGCEGCGTIVEVGKDVSPDVIGKKVAFDHNAYSQYAAAKYQNVIFLDDTQDLSKAANATINPLTALTMI